MNDIPLLNPLAQDFTVLYDVHHDGSPEAFTIHAKEIERFPKEVFNHIAKHLAYEVAAKKGFKPNSEQAIKDAYDLITKI
jgi:hypothetical protein